MPVTRKPGARELDRERQADVAEADHAAARLPAPDLVDHSCIAHLRPVRLLDVAQVLETLLDLGLFLVGVAAVVGRRGDRAVSLGRLVGTFRPSLGSPLLVALARGESLRATPASCRARSRPMNTAWLSRGRIVELEPGELVPAAREVEEAVPVASREAHDALGAEHVGGQPASSRRTRSCRRARGVR